MKRRHFLKTTATGAIAPLIASPLLAQSSQEKNPKVKELRDRIRPITKEERRFEAQAGERENRSNGDGEKRCVGGADDVVRDACPPSVWWDG